VQAMSGPVMHISDCSGDTCKSSAGDSQRLPVLQSERDVTRSVSCMSVVSLPSILMLFENTSHSSGSSSLPPSSLWLSSAANGLA
jgi:hypothetical protein